MQAKLLDGTGGRQSWVVVFEAREEAISGLTAFASEHDICAASFTAIGAFSQATLGYFDWESKLYERIPIGEQVEVVTLLGDIALQNGAPKVHAHASLAKRGGSMAGGHLLEAYVRPTLEVILTQAEQHLERQYDAESGIALIRP